MQFTGKGTISVCFVEGLLQGVRSQGFDTDELLEQCGLAPAILRMPNARVSASTYTVLLRLVAQILDDEFFGMDSRRMKVGSFAMLCRAAVHGKSLEKAAGRALRFFALCLDDLKGELWRQGDFLRLRLRQADRDRPPPVFAQETLLMFMHRLICWLVNRRIPVLAAEFAYPQPPHAGEYRLMFAQNCRFAQPATALVFEARHFSLPVVRTEKALKEFLRIAPENLLVQYRDRFGVGASLHKLLAPLPPADWPTFEAVAERLGGSASTLRRRLEGEGLSYQSIKDNLRRDRAIDLLSGTNLSVMDIAAELGFAEASAFHRAFRKWMGVNPGEYRRALAAAE